MTWTANKRDGTILSKHGNLIATTEFGQRHHTELLGQAQNMRKLLARCIKATSEHDSRLAHDIQEVLNKTR